MDFVSTLCGHVLAWSPNGKLLAATTENKLEIRDSESLEVMVLGFCVCRVISNVFVVVFVHSPTSTGIAGMDVRGQDTADRVGLGFCSNSVHHV